VNRNAVGLKSEVLRFYAIFQEVLNVASFFKKILGKSGKKKDDPYQSARPVEPSNDPEYIAYCIELERTVSALEAYLHTSDDPREIAIETLKTACRFYGGNWAGILDVDIDLDVWTPLWWYNHETRDMTSTLLHEFEMAKYMPSWVGALEEGNPLIIPDVTVFKNTRPEEYEVYQRLKVDSVIGVPFGPNPVGFLAIRNPTRYINRPSMMSILAYVLHRAMAQQKTIDSAKLSLSPDEIYNDKDIIINFFGSMEICTASGILRERDFKSPKSSRVATYLMLNRKSSHPPMEIVQALWPDEPEEWEALSGYIRGYIFKFRKAFELISPYPLIESTPNGYRINPEFHIMTDLQQFDMLWEQAQHSITLSHKVDLLKQAVELYKGTVFENACDEHWIIGTVTHYKFRYTGIVNELLATLADVKDYTGIQHYAAKAIVLVPENIKARYWLICAIYHLGSLELAKNEMDRAEHELTGEEYASLKKMLYQDHDLPYNTILGMD